MQGSMCNAGDLRPPRTPLRMDLVYTYKASADLPGALSYHLQDLAEAAIIAHEQVIRQGLAQVVGVGVNRC